MDLKRDFSAADHGARSDLNQTVQSADAAAAKSPQEFGPVSPSHSEPSRPLSRAFAQAAVACATPQMQGKHRARSAVAGRVAAITRKHQTVDEVLQRLASPKSVSPKMSRSSTAPAALTTLVRRSPLHASGTDVLGGKARIKQDAALDHVSREQVCSDGVQALDRLPVGWDSNWSEKGGLLHKKCTLSIVVPPPLRSSATGRRRAPWEPIVEHPSSDWGVGPAKPRASRLGMYSEWLG